MYRIEVAAGEETVFRTIEELATGIRNGLITPRSRIYHAASQKWLPIEFHPHYKKALQLVTGGAPMIDTGVTRPSTRRTPAPQTEPGRGGAAAPVPPSAPSPRAETPRPVAAEPRQVDAPAMWNPPVEPPRPVSRPLEHRPSHTRPAEMPAVETDAVEHALVDAHAVATLEPDPPADEVVLPRISYPELPAPPAESMPVARRRSSGPGSLVITAIAAVALIGGYFATTSEAPSQSEETVAAPAEGGPNATTTPAPTAAAPTPTRAPAPPATPTPLPAPAGVVESAGDPLRPMQAAPRPSGPVSQAWSSSAGAIAPLPAPARPAPAPASEAPAIMPPPAALDLTLPQLSLDDSIGIASGVQRDSAAIKRILRAVSGPPSSKADR